MNNAENPLITGLRKLLQRDNASISLSDDLPEEWKGRLEGLSREDMLPIVTGLEAIKQGLVVAREGNLDGSISYIFRPKPGVSPPLHEIQKSEKRRGPLFFSLPSED